ncbi:MAG: hypothetical protein K0R60_655, partial [Microbacterium sp.]|nr:hypothetical protein [Microbacterium sp.]
MSHAPSPESGTPDAAPALAAVTTRKKPLADRIPVVSHLRQSVGLQRGMLLV